MTEWSVSDTYVNDNVTIKRSGAVAHRRPLGVSLGMTKEVFRFFGLKK